MFHHPVTRPRPSPFGRSPRAARYDVSCGRPRETLQHSAPCHLQLHWFRRQLSSVSCTPSCLCMPPSCIFWDASSPPPAFDTAIQLPPSAQGTATPDWPTQPRSFRSSTSQHAVHPLGRVSFPGATTHQPGCITTTSRLPPHHLLSDASREPAQGDSAFHLHLHSTPRRNTRAHSVPPPGIYGHLINGFCFISFLV
jgi:hypothetical protein